MVRPRREQLQSPNDLRRLCQWQRGNVGKHESLAMRTGGGASFGCRLSVERNFRDARAASVMAPTTDVLYDLIARTLLEMPLF